VHAGGGERVAVAGKAALAGEDRGDLGVGVVLGEAADERDRVLVGGARVASRARQPHAVVGDRAAVQDDPYGGPVVCAVDGDDDLGDDRAQQPLALAVAGGERVEHRA
jgi:hypothetical protein